MTGNGDQSHGCPCFPGYHKIFNRYLSPEMDVGGDFYGINEKRLHFRETFIGPWEHTGSNRGPSACKADALNQLSYAPIF
jgi:hypothetical protein